MSCALTEKFKFLGLRYCFCTPQKSLTRAETTVFLYRMLLKAGLIDG
ncbi:hypothetical protein FHS14_004947 [Paenibacillus baekrokdamisoli]|nr:hypothetical protein [Paenibacillus baekrokdamisoli]